MQENPLKGNINWRLRKVRADLSHVFWIVVETFSDTNAKKLKEMTKPTRSANQAEIEEGNDLYDNTLDEKIPGIDN